MMAWRYSGLLVRLPKIQRIDTTYKRRATRSESSSMLPSATGRGCAWIDTGIDLRRLVEVSVEELMLRRGGKEGKWLY
jgi:hypothetical protein